MQISCVLLLFRQRKKYPKNIVNYIRTLNPIARDSLSVDGMLRSRVLHLCFRIIDLFDEYVLCSTHKYRLLIFENLAG